MQSGFTNALVTAIFTMQLVACGSGSGSGSGEVDAASAISTNSAIISETNYTSSIGSGTEVTTAAETSSSVDSNSSLTNTGDGAENISTPSAGTDSIATVVMSTSGDEAIALETMNTGSISLQWTAPVTRADGTPLSLAEIAGYYIYYGESEGIYTNRVNLDDGAAQTVYLNDIPVGTYYLVMTTYDNNGRESSYSSVVKKTAI